MDTKVVAEAGVNHDGCLRTALELILAAKQAGADAIKFQIFSTDHLVVKNASSAPYQIASGIQNQHRLLKQLEFDRESFFQLRAYCRTVGIEFFASVFDKPSLDLLLELDVNRIKLGSGEITNWPLLASASQTGKSLLLSTGMATLGEIEDALNVVSRHGAKDITLLHCVSQYPAADAEINLRAMDTLQYAFGLPVGFSDHTPGTCIALAAAARGASLVEKHLTLNRKRSGPDHAASIEPHELTSLVSDIKRISQALGTGRVVPVSGELENRDIVRKSLTAAIDISCGTIIDQTHLTIRRPGTGIAPRWLETVLGRTAIRDINEGEVLTWEDI